MSRNEFFMHVCKKIKYVGVDNNASSGEAFNPKVSINI